MTHQLGPGPIHRSETTSTARYVGARSSARPLVGLASIVVAAAVIAVAVGLFQGDFTKSVPVIVVSPRAGLVMNPDAKVKMRGVQVGKFGSIEERPDGDAVPGRRQRAALRAAPPSADDARPRGRQ